MKRQRDVVDHHDTPPAGKIPKADVSDELQHLLDFSSLTAAADISARFEAIAAFLLREYRIVVTCGDTETIFEILELEFYLRKQGYHDDPFTHGSEEQKISGRWYFHRAPRRSTTPTTTTPGYRGGSRKGLDLTFGSAVPSNAATASDSHRHPIRGGILFRTLHRISDGKIISGPSLLVDEILRASRATSIPDLVHNKWQNDIWALSSFAPRQRDDRTSLTFMRLQRGVAIPDRSSLRIFRSPRIGLDLSHSDTTDSLKHPRVIYISKLYRFFTNPTRLTSNGRGHTFLGVYQFCKDASPLKSNPALLADASRLSGMNRTVIARYLEDYEDGIANGVLKPFVGKSGKGAGSSPATFLRLMGTLRHLQQ